MSKIIENYCLNEVLGVGQYGKVYKALNIKTNHTFAVKVVKKQKFDEVEKLEEFTRNEIQTLARIDCPNIVKFVEMLKTANHYYFVYEYCNGGTLEHLLKQKGHFYETEALVIFSQIVHAYTFLVHDLIMHRDLKPANILLNNDQVKLADFGFCRSLNTERDMAQTMVGSPIYMAPEILFGKEYGQVAEIWSLGCLLYEMLYGECPYEEKSIAALIIRLEKDTKGIVFPSDKNMISSETENLIRRMVTIDPAKRITFKELFENEWIKRHYPNNEFDFSSFHRNNSDLSIEAKIVRKKNDRALKYLCHERNKLYYLYSVLSKMLLLNCSQATPIMALLIMKIAKSRSRQMRLNLVDNLNPSAFGQLRKLIENWDVVRLSFEYKSFVNMLGKEIEIIEKQYPLFKAEADKFINLGTPLFFPEEDLREFVYLEDIDYKKLNKCFIFYVEDIKKTFFYNPLESRDDENEMKFLIHINDILDVMSLDDFFENVLDIYVKFDDQKYFEMVQKYNKDHLLNIVNHKIVSTKIRLEIEK